jgi:uncharacterized protein YceH (UPF0502 family)
MSIDDHQANASAEPIESEASPRKWRPLPAVPRRILGVLAEKAKTTPEQYPLSLNALTTGCNQKSNRNPQMNLDSDEVEQVLEELRELGAVVEVQGGGRVAKYKHCLYDWLGVDKAELAVMAELLLRGEQTVGELRGRAARMEPIADLHALRPILQSLIEKGLVLELTPEGRGQIITHGLYNETRLAELREQYHESSAARAPVSRAAPPSAAAGDAFRDLQQEVAALKEQVAELRQDLEQLKQDQGTIS